MYLHLLKASYTCMCPHEHAHMHAHVGTHTHTRVRAQTHMHMYTCVHTHTCTRTCTCAHTRTHAHTHTHTHTNINHFRQFHNGVAFPSEQATEITPYIATDPEEVALVWHLALVWNLHIPCVVVLSTVRHPVQAAVGVGDRMRDPLYCCWRYRAQS